MWAIFPPASRNRQTIYRAGQILTVFRVASLTVTTWTGLHNDEGLPVCAWHETCNSGVIAWTMSTTNSVKQSSNYKHLPVRSGIQVLKYYLDVDRDEPISIAPVLLEKGKSHVIQGY